MLKGYLIDIQHFSVNDGDGIRTNLFFAGCPLRCSWCSNPEGFTTMNKVMHISKSCMRCGRCQNICLYGVGMDLDRHHQRIKCRNCGACTVVCPSHSRQNMIYSYTVEDILQKTSAYFSFFKKSGGGITYSGGECTTQWEFLDQLSQKYYDLNIHQAMESSGEFVFENVEKILHKMDLIFFDIKLIDQKKHRYYTGKSNERILENIKQTGKFHKNMVIRIPVIEGINATEENIRETANFVKANIPHGKMELLRYHKLGSIKYESLGMSLPSETYQTPSKEKMVHFNKIIMDLDVELISYQ